MKLPFSENIEPLIKNQCMSCVKRIFIASAITCGLAILILSIVAIRLTSLDADDYMLEEAEYLLSDIQADGTLIGGARTAWRHLEVRYIQYALIKRLHATIKLPPDESDPEHLLRMLLVSKRFILNQSEIPHPLSIWTSIISGLGWCNQSNETAGVLVAQEFGKAEVIGVSDPKRNIGHSIARVWSKKMNRWLYFDMWANEVVVFSFGADKKIIYHARARPNGDTSTLTESEAAIFRILYSQAERGIICGRFPNSFSEYLMQRLLRVTTKQLRPPVEANVKMFSEIPLSKSSEQRSLYILARKWHLRMNFPEASFYYKASAALDPNSETALGAAARRFYEHLKTP